MLDLGPKILLRFSRSAAAGRSGRGHRNFALHLKMATRFSIVLIASLSLSAAAQQQSPSSYSGSTDNSNTWDCSDPLLAASSQCAGQNSNESGQYSVGGSQIRTSPFASLPNGPQTNPGQTYSDQESRLGQPSARTRALNGLVPPPQPLTEFQKFVATTTGQVFPIFGASLFQNVPSTFAPLDNAPVPPDYIIGPGDELRIRVWGQVNFQANVRVDRAGEIYIPVSQIGPVHVAGLPYSELQAHLREAIGREI